MALPQPAVSELLEAFRARASCVSPYLQWEGESVTERNVLGGDLEPCGTQPMMGFFRDGCCNCGEQDEGSHTICAGATVEFSSRKSAASATTWVRR